MKKNKGLVQYSMPLLVFLLGVFSIPGIRVSSQDAMMQAPGGAAGPSMAQIGERVLNGSQDWLPKNGPSYFAALQAVAEAYAGKPLSIEEKKASINDLKADNKIDSEFTVQDAYAVLSDALTRLGINSTTLTISIVRPSTSTPEALEQAKSEAYASLRHVSTLTNPNLAGHWQLGDATGNFVWDPISASNEMGRKNFPENTRYVIIKSKS